MAAQAEQDFRHVFSCVSDIRLLIRAGDQVADEFFLSVRISEEIGCEKILPVCFAGNGTLLAYSVAVNNSINLKKELWIYFQSDLWFVP